MTPKPPSVNYVSSPPITVILTIILLVFFFLGFFSVYFCRCFLENLSNTWNMRRSPSRNVESTDASATTGLQPALIQAFPTFEYSSVKDFRKEKYGLECAICLVEFEDDSLLRLLTVCYHVFHQECIDLWLESHKTCPVCRGNLDLQPDSLEKPLELVEQTATHDIHRTNESLEAAILIDIQEHENERAEREGAIQEQAFNTHRNDKDLKVQRFPRSHSTGHSIVRTREDEDRYTLRLPEDVKGRLIRRHNFARSCTAFGEYSDHKVAGNGGFG